MIISYRFLFFLGIITLLVPFLGIPQSWKEIILLIVGLLLIAMALFVRNKSKVEEYKTKEEEEVFVENDEGSSEVSKISVTEEKPKEVQDDNLDVDGIHEREREETAE